MKKIIFISAFFICMTITSLSWAGPETLRGGQAYVGYSFAYSDGIEFIADTTFYNQYLFFAVSFIDAVDIYGSIPFIIARETDNSDIDYNNFGDGLFGIKLGVFNENQNDLFTLSFGADIKTPLNHYNPNLHTSPGQAQEDISIYGVAGKYLPASQFIQGGFGYRFRFQDPADQIYGSLTYGFFWSDIGFGVALAFEFVESLWGKSTKDIGWTYTNVDSDYGNLILKFSYVPVENLYTEFNAGYTVYADNAAKFLGLSIHVGYLFDFN